MVKFSLSMLRSHTGATVVYLQLFLTSTVNGGVGSNSPPSPVYPQEGTPLPTEQEVV